MRICYLLQLALAALVTSSLMVSAAILRSEVVYYPRGFYGQVENGLRDSALKSRLFEILTKGHVRSNGHDELRERCNPDDRSCYRRVSLGYTRARQILFGEIHLQNGPSGYAILDVYCQHLATAQDFKHNPPGPNQIPDASVLNAEHTWPQSHFSGRFARDLQKSDLNILYPVMSNANSSRGNFPFGNVTTALDQPCAGAMRGYSARGGKEVFFEVPDVHKGNVARAIFYFAVRYQMQVDAEEQATLRAWNRLDPVDEFERKRNETVYIKQKDRNPFIDHSELVDLISEF